MMSKRENTTTHMPPPGVSVIITVRNGQKTVEASLDSVINQTATDWEVVIVDDGSTDGTASILASYADKDPRFKIITTTGIGRGHALNLALKNAQAPLVANLDADDLCHPERLEIQSRVMDQHPEITLLSTRHVVIGANEIPRWDSYGGQSSGAPLLDLANLLLLANVIDHSSVMFRRDVIFKIGGYDTTRKRLFDYELWLRLLEHKLCVRELGITLTAKRVHPNQSYEHKNKWSYRFATLTLHYQKLARIRPPLRFWLAPFAQLIWLATPRIVKTSVGKHLKSTKVRT